MAQEEKLSFFPTVVYYCEHTVVDFINRHKLNMTSQKKSKNLSFASPWKCL